MSDDWLYALVLLAAAAHAFWNALVKGADDPVLMMAAIRIVGLALGLAVLPFVPPLPMDAWPWLAAAVAAHCAYYALLIGSYRIGDMSLVYPLARGIAPLLLTAVAFAVLGERLSPGQAAAVALISAGIAALSFGGRRDLRAVRFALATGACIAAYSFLGGAGVRAAGSVLAFQAWLEILTGTAMAGFALWSRRGAAIAFARKSGATGLAAGLVSVCGYLAYLAAVQVLPFGPVAALRETSVVFGAAIGAVVFKEAFGVVRLAAAGLILAGLAGLALAR